MKTGLISKIGMKASTMMGRTGFKLQKKSPEILMVAGIIGVVGAGVLACRATLKCEDILIDAGKQKNRCLEARDLHDEKAYNEDDYKRDLVIIYTQTAVKFVKLYGPAVTLGAVSIACIIGAHGIMKKRNVALIAAYKALEEGFAAYRRRVIEEYGEEKDYMLKNGIRAEEVTVEETDAETGKKKKVKKTEYTFDGNGLSPYGRIFDKNTAGNWSPDKNVTRAHVIHCQTIANDILRSRGHVLLNDIYDMFDFPRTSEGAVVGWLKDGDGDGYIDFGLQNGLNSVPREYPSEFGGVAIILDFNVDGVIFKEI